MTPPNNHLFKDAIAALLAGHLNDSSQELTFDSHGSGEGACQMRVYRGHGAVVVFCSELASNPGPNLTDAAPGPWEAAMDEITVEAHETVYWVEHQPPTAESTVHAFDLLEQRRSGLHWKPLPRLSDAA